MSTLNTLRRRFSMTALLAGALMLAALPTLAGARESRSHERSENRAEVRVDRSDVADDVSDIARLDRLVDAWRAAARRGDALGMRLADKGLDAWMRGELGDARADLRDANVEVSRSRAELRSEQRDVPHARSRGGAGAARGQAAEVRDDRRDLADDRSDLRDDRRDLTRTRAVARELDQLQVRFDRGTARPADYQRKAELLDELLQMARQELREDRGEAREDRRERAEDRRDR